MLRGDGVELLHPLLDGPAIRPGRLLPILAPRWQLGLHLGDQALVEELDQVRPRRLPDADEVQELLGLERWEIEPVLRPQPRQVVVVDRPEQVEDRVRVVLDRLAPLLEERARLGTLEEVEVLAGAAQAAQDPDELHVLAPQPRRNLDPGPHRDPHRLPGLDELRDGLGRRAVIVDHRHLADALDPGIHHEVGRRLAPLGVRVVDVVVEGDLVPALRHLEQVVPGELTPHRAGTAGGRGEELVRDLDLVPRIAVGLAYQVLHRLEQRAPGVAGHRFAAPLDQLLAERTQRDQPVLGPIALERVEQLDDRVGDAPLPRGGELVDAARVQVGVEQPARPLPLLGCAHELVDSLNELEILIIEEKERFCVQLHLGHRAWETNSDDTPAFTGGQNSGSRAGRARRSVTPRGISTSSVRHDSDKVGHDSDMTARLVDFLKRAPTGRRYLSCRAMQTVSVDNMMERTRPRAPGALTKRERRSLAVQAFLGRFAFIAIGPAAVFLMRWVRGHRIEGLRAARRIYQEAVATGRPTLVCANHLTMFDSAFLLHAFGSTFDYLANFRLFSWNVPAVENFTRSLFWRTVVYFGKCVPIDRAGDPAHHRTVLDRLAYLVTRREVCGDLPGRGT